MPWHTRLVRLGRSKTMVLLTAFSVVASIVLVGAFAFAFDAQREELLLYFVPGVMVPLVVAPVVIHLLLSLAVALNTAHAQAAEQQAQLQRVRQLDLVGRLAGGLAHDFNNLLTVVRANVEALGGAAAHDELAAIDDAALRGARLTRRLLSISRRDDVVLVPQSLVPLLQETEDMLRRVLPTGVQLTMPAVIPDTVLSLDRDAVQQALLNLVLNARDAMGETGALVLTVKPHQTGRDCWLVVEVRDTGPGMNGEQLARAIEPFYTTKGAHEGTGLGLAIVHRSMEQHGGRLVLDSAPDAGTRAALWFPVPAVNLSARAPEPSTPVLSQRTPEGSGSYDLIVVDDEPHVRRATERTVQRLGHRVTSVADIASALEILEAGTKVDVIISDIMMPGGTGIELVSRLRRRGLQTPVLLVSGFSVDSLDDALSTDPAVGFLAKPWSLDALVAGIEQVRHGAPG